MNIPVIVNDVKGFKDIYQVKPSKQTTFKKSYFKCSKYEKPSEVFEGRFKGNTDMSYGDPLEILMSLE